jgi:hypothetical protein
VTLNWWQWWLGKSGPRSGSGAVLHEFCAEVGSCCAVQMGHEVMMNEMFLCIRNLGLVTKLHGDR